MELLPNVILNNLVKPWKSKLVRDPNETDPQLSSFYLIEGSREKVTRIISIVLQIEDEPRTFKEGRSYGFEGFLF